MNARREYSQPAPECMHAEYSYLLWTYLSPALHFHFFRHIELYDSLPYHRIKKARSSVDGWSAMLRARRLGVRIPMRSLNVSNLLNSEPLITNYSASDRNEYQKQEKVYVE
jgi:hypothetical protein